MVHHVGRSTEQLLLGEWACLGILYPKPTHGFAIAARLKPHGDVGRVWSLSRALTYRSLDQLAIRDYIRPSARSPESPVATERSSPPPEPDVPSFANGSPRPSSTSATSAANCCSN